MAVISSSKIALHLYLNNPYGLISAAIPNYSVNSVELGTTPLPGPSVNKSSADVGGSTSGSPQKLTLHTNEIGSHTPLPERTEAYFVGKFEKKSKTPTEEVPKMYKNKNNDRNKLSVLENRNSSQATRMTDGSKCPYPTPSPVFIDKSPRSKSTSPQNEVHAVPALGFTWSLNLDRRERFLSTKKPPPDAILEKLGKMRRGDPVGIIKLKRERINPNLYNIHRIFMNDRSQRKMAERLHEWLDQYTETSRKQQAYLDRIHDLRRNLQNKDNKHVIETVDRMRTGPKFKHKRKYPIYTLTRMEEASINQGPSPFPSRPSHFMVDDKNGYSKLKIVPHAQPRKLAPITKRGQTNCCHNKSPSPENIYGEMYPKDTSRPSISTSRMKTEYEPFESIAKRNRLNLTQFFNSGLSHRRSHQRLPMNLSTVTIINEKPEPEPESKTFITDFAARKPVLNGGKDSD